MHQVRMIFLDKISTIFFLTITEAFANSLQRFFFFLVFSIIDLFSIINHSQISILRFCKTIPTLLIHIPKSIASRTFEERWITDETANLSFALLSYEGRKIFFDDSRRFVTLGVLKFSNFAPASLFDHAQCTTLEQAVFILFVYSMVSAKVFTWSDRSAWEPLEHRVYIYFRFYRAIYHVFKPLSSSAAFLWNCTHLEKQEYSLISTFSVWSKSSRSKPF